MTAEEYFKEWGSICRVYQNEDLIHPHSTLLQFAEAYLKEELLAYQEWYDSDMLNNQISSVGECVDNYLKTK